MRKLLSISLFLGYTLLQQEASAAAAPSFYSVDSVVENVSVADVGTIRPLVIQAPEYLYHWITVKSLKRLLPNTNVPSPFPLKTLNDSIFAAYSPAFYGRQGLFTWHNPVGARTGGTNEVYGNGEALIALKINNSAARIGLVVSAENQDAKRLVGPIPDFDIILHVNGYVHDGKFLPGLFEWILINPALIKSFTANPENIEPEFKSLHREITKLETKKKKSKLTPIEIIAGQQHNDVDEYQLTSAKIVDIYGKLLKFKKRTPKWLQSGWINNPSLCQKFYSPSNK